MIRLAAFENLLRIRSPDIQTFADTHILEKLLWSQVERVFRADDGLRHARLFQSKGAFISLSKELRDICIQSLNRPAP